MEFIVLVNYYHGLKNLEILAYTMYLAIQLAIRGESSVVLA